MHDAAWPGKTAKVHYHATLAAFCIGSTVHNAAGAHTPTKTRQAALAAAACPHPGGSIAISHIHSARPEKLFVAHSFGARRFDQFGRGLAEGGDGGFQGGVSYERPLEKVLIHNARACSTHAIRHPAAPPPKCPCHDTPGRERSASNVPPSSMRGCDAVASPRMATADVGLSTDSAMITPETEPDAPTVELFGESNAAQRPPAHPQAK